MPSQRKRIGFLPSEEVQNIIDQISHDNKLSQSKVTGILVEEALISRGVLNYSLNNKHHIDNKYKTLLSTNDSFYNESDINNDILNLEESNIKDEVQMINDFIEFKFFKSIMIKNKKNI